MQLYNIQECFEALGSKFPFIVYWHNPYYKEQLGFYEITDFKHDYMTWSHKKRDQYNPFFPQLIAIQKQFSYKITEYNRDFEDLIK